MMAEKAADMIKGKALAVGRVGRSEKAAAS
jgi:hypothetical protein